MATKGNELELSKKIELIRDYDASKQSHRALAEKYNIGRTQVSNILKRKKEIIEAFEENVDSKKKRVGAFPNEQFEKVI
jgi:predicted DNA-binding protein YlxM (UPF0122 family)